MTIDSINQPFGTSRRLDGVAFVTGGGRGVGANIARGLSRAGMRVAVGARTALEVDAIADEIGGVAVELDVTDEASVEAAVDAAERNLGPLDVLVCNAGVLGADDPFSAHTTEEWWRAFEVNVLGTYLCSRVVVPRMAGRGGGRVIVVASGASHLPVGESVAPTGYGSSKAAVYRFTEMLAARYKHDGVFFFSLTPGLVRTRMTESGRDDDAPWTSPEAAPRLVVELVSGGLDALTGRYFDAKDPDPEHLRDRVEEILEQDLFSVRLRR